MDITAQLSEIMNRAVTTCKTVEEQAAERRKRERDKKRNQRLKTRHSLAAGRPDVSTSNLQLALLDALSWLLHHDDPEGHVAAVLVKASEGFLFPPQAENVLRRYLMGRTPKILVDRPND